MGRKDNFEMASNLCIRVDGCQMIRRPEGIRPSCIGAGRRLLLKGQRRRERPAQSVKHSAPAPGKKR